VTTADLLRQAEELNAMVDQGSGRANGSSNGRGSGANGH
jgi:hypothetical protein